MKKTYLFYSAIFFYRLKEAFRSVLRSPLKRLFIRRNAFSTEIHGIRGKSAIVGSNNISIVSQSTRKTLKNIASKATYLLPSRILPRGHRFLKSETHPSRAQSKVVCV